MKKGILVLVLIAAAAGAALMIPRLTEKKPPVRGELVEPRTGNERTSTGSVRSEELKGAPVGSVRSGEPAESAPLQVRFEASAKAQLNQPAVVTLIVEKGPGWSAQADRSGELELLLRLPVGIKLASEEGWTAAQPSSEEKEDPTGPWSAYERNFLLSADAGSLPDPLAKVEVPLIVVEEGINWIISSRARWTAGAEAWQAFGVLFATVQGTDAEFHQAPKTPSDTLSAKAY